MPGTYVHRVTPPKLGPKPEDLDWGLSKEVGGAREREVACTELCGKPSVVRCMCFCGRLARWSGGTLSFAFFCLWGTGRHGLIWYRVLAGQRSTVQTFGLFCLFLHRGVELCEASWMWHIVRQCFWFQLPSRIFRNALVRAWWTCCTFWMSSPCGCIRIAATWNLFHSRKLVELFSLEQPQFWTTSTTQCEWLSVVPRAGTTDLCKYTCGFAQACGRGQCAVATSSSRWTSSCSKIWATCPLSWWMPCASAGHGSGRVAAPVPIPPHTAPWKSRKWKPLSVFSAGTTRISIWHVISHWTEGVVDTLGTETDAEEDPLRLDG